MQRGGTTPNRTKRQLAKFKESYNSQVFEGNWKLYVLGLRSPVGALRARRRRFAAITGSKYRIKSYPLLASSQHVGVTAAMIIFRVVVF